MSIHHRRTDILVAKEFLDGPYVVARFQQVSGERMSKGMTSGTFDNSGFADSVFYGSLHQWLIDIVNSPCTMGLCIEYVLTELA